MKMSSKVLPLLLVMTLILILTAAVSFAETVDATSSPYQPDTKAIVNNYNDIGLLNLRLVPDKSADRLMQYYSGAEVTILEDFDEQWVKVRVGYLDSGYLEGYMMKEFLAVGDAVANVVDRVVYCRADAKSFPLKTKPELDAPDITYSGGGQIHVDVTQPLAVLGAKGKWLHVSFSAPDSGNPRADEAWNVLYTGFINWESTDSSSSLIWWDAWGQFKDTVIDYSEQARFSKAELNNALTLVLKDFIGLDLGQDRHGPGYPATKVYYDQTTSDSYVIANVTADGKTDEELLKTNILFKAEYEGGEVTWALTRESDTSPWSIVAWDKKP
ncbi:hypothetical protein FACS1894184_11340 [Clostridia bacterium]|nr:hypothetical protein FACS1894184_11340 [Clostridia bacterium]